MQVSVLLAAAGTAAKRWPGRAIGPSPVCAARSWPTAVRRKSAPVTSAARPPGARCGLAAANRPVRSAMPCPKRLAVPASASAAGVVHREFGNPPLWRLAFDLRQRRPNQPAMDWAVNRRLVRGLRITSLNGGSGLALWGLGPAQCFKRGADHWRHSRRHDHAGRWQWRRAGPGLLLPRRRHFRGAILVFRVARRAAHLADVVTHHRHDRVIADAPLARTVVIH